MSTPLTALALISLALASDLPAPVKLVVTESTVEIDGRTAPVFRAQTGSGESARSIVRGRKGERLRVELENRTTLPITMHPHGVILPNAQDGVPYVTQEPVPPGGTFTYDFVPVQAGTYFFHSHFGWELQDQLAIPFILEAPEVKGTRAESPPREVVMMLTDFVFRSPPEIFESLRKAPTKAMPGVPDMPGMPGAKEMPATGSKPDTQTKPDLNDVDYDAVLANGRPAGRAEVVSVEPGSRVRLRLINGSSASNFVVSFGRLRGSIVAVDGEPIQPVEMPRIELPIAQRIDLLIDLPQDFASVPITAQAEGTKLVAGIVLAATGAAVPTIPARAETALGRIGGGYDQERSFHAVNPLPKRPVNRSVVVDLTGKMAGYVWSLNDMEWPKGPRIQIKEGERVEMVFTNETMMSHPMHLHGHRFQVTEIDGQPIDGAVRDTILVMPKSTVKVQFDADAPGLWMMHCHITWHEAAGMLGIIEYEGFPKPSWYLSKDTFNEPSSLPRN